jgi:hypothetical protein
LVGIMVVESFVSYGIENFAAVFTQTYYLQHFPNCQCFLQ